MRTPAAILLAFSIVVGSGPCVAQSALDLPLERLEQPIALAYNELERRNFSTHLEVTAFKGDNTFSSHEWRSEGTISSRAMGDDLEVSLKVILDNDMVSQPVCIMHRTGEIIDCTAGGGLDTLGFFIFYQQGYKSGDSIKWPGLTGAGVVRNIFGRVLGKSSLDNTQILVIDFGEKLREKMDDPESNMLIDVTLVAVGHAYLDMVSGFPIELKVSVEMTGKFSAGIDRYVFDVGYVMRK